MDLPKIYNDKMWERGGSIEAHKKYIGKPYISWSAVETWRSSKGFNTGQLGRIEFMMKYFLGERFPDMGWGQFGNETESYICERQFADMFEEHERKVLDTITPLGVFQREVIMPFRGFILIGYIDDMTPPDEKGNVELVRDYKTKSKSSKKDLHDVDKLQLDLYIGALQKEGLKVKKAEYCIIERLGGRECMQGKGRVVLSIGKEVWYEDYSFNNDTIKRAKDLVREAAKEISEYWKVFKMLNK
tara:strand:+ start:10 stop:741 length:732 start_codon:yes stop_codon:yes gene_type:complete